MTHILESSQIIRTEDEVTLAIEFGNVPEGAIDSIELNHILMATRSYLYLCSQFQGSDIARYQEQYVRFDRTSDSDVPTHTEYIYRPRLRISYISYASPLVIWLQAGGGVMAMSGLTYVAGQIWQTIHSAKVSKARADTTVELYEEYRGVAAEQREDIRREIEYFESITTKLEVTSLKKPVTSDDGDA